MWGYRRRGWGGGGNRDYDNWVSKTQAKGMYPSLTESEICSVKSSWRRNQYTTYAVYKVSALDKLEERKRAIAAENERRRLEAHRAELAKEAAKYGCEVRHLNTFKTMLQHRETLVPVYQQNLPRVPTLDEIVTPKDAHSLFGLTKGRIEKMNVQDHGPLNRSKSSYLVADLLKIVTPKQSTHTLLTKKFYDYNKNYPTLVSLVDDYYKKSLHSIGSLITMPSSTPPTEIVAVSTSVKKLKVTKAVPASVETVAATPTAAVTTSSATATTTTTAAPQMEQPTPTTTPEVAATPATSEDSATAATATPTGAKTPSQGSKRKTKSKSTAKKTPKASSAKKAKTSTTKKKQPSAKKASSAKKKQAKNLPPLFKASAVIQVCYDEKHWCNGTILSVNEDDRKYEIQCDLKKLQDKPLKNVEWTMVRALPEVNSSRRTRASKRGVDTTRVEYDGPSSSIKRRRTANAVAA